MGLLLGVSCLHLHTLFCKIWEKIEKNKRKEMLKPTNKISALTPIPVI